MPGTLVISTLSDGTNSTSATNCISGSAKVWVNFTGSTGAISGSYNVSSITRNGTGDYTLNFTSSLTDANYSCVSTASADSTAQAPTFRFVAGYRTASTCRLLVFNYGTGGAVDVAENDVAIFR